MGIVRATVVWYVCEALVVTCFANDRTRDSVLQVNGDSPNEGQQPIVDASMMEGSMPFNRNVNMARPPNLPPPPPLLTVNPGTQPPRPFTHMGKFFAAILAPWGLIEHTQTQTS